MSITATEVASGARMRYTPQGGQIIRRFAVQGLDPTLPDNVTRAVSSLPGSAQYQQPHPTVIGFYCMGFEATPMGSPESPNKSGAWVDVVYGTPDFIPNSTMIEIGGVNGTRNINRWPYGANKGQPIFVGYNTDPAGIFFDPQITADYVVANNANARPGSNSFFQVANIPWYSSGILLIFTRRESTVPAIATYRNKVNATFWQGQGAGVWLCRQITARNIVSAGPIFPGGGYEVRYEFMTSDDLELPPPLLGHTVVAFFKDLHSGQEVPGVDPTDGTNNGYTVVKPANSVEFSTLGLPAVF